MSRKNISDTVTRAAIGEDDGATLVVRNARAAVHIVRMESDTFEGGRYFLRGDAHTPMDAGFTRAIEALRAALEVLAEFNKG